VQADCLAGPIELTRTGDHEVACLHPVA
jgi:hypothetical protein